MHILFQIYQALIKDLKKSKKHPDTIIVYQYLESRLNHNQILLSSSSTDETEETT